MSKTWYPMINGELCTECGACISKCTHGVYNEDKAPRPVVVYPEGCIQGCTGCGSLCPNDAIIYFGESSQTVCGEGCGCQGGCGCDGTE